MAFDGNVVQKTLTFNNSPVKITEFVVNDNKFTGVMEVLTRKFNISGSFSDYDISSVDVGKMKGNTLYMLYGTGTAQLWPAFNPVDILERTVKFKLVIARVNSNNDKTAFIGILMKLGNASGSAVDVDLANTSPAGSFLTSRSDPVSAGVIKRL